MSQYHLKRLTAPRTWKILRKTTKYITRPKPGPHPIGMAISLNELVIGMGLARTKKEVKRIIHDKKIFLNGRQVYDVKKQAGFMDVISFPDSKEAYRITITKQGLTPIPIPSSEEGIKPVKITGKTSLSGNKTQIHTSDGRNILLEKNMYKVGDSLVLEIPSQKIKDYLPLQKGAAILLYKGTHAGITASVESVEEKEIFFAAGKEKKHTKKEYALVIGKDKPAIKL